MYSDTHYITTKDQQNRTQVLEERLRQAQGTLKESIVLSLEEVEENPHIEKELIPMWANYVQDLFDFFVLETEKRGISDVGKRVMKYVMFKRI